MTQTALGGSLDLTHSNVSKPGFVRFLHRTVSSLPAAVLKPTDFRSWQDEGIEALHAKARPVDACKPKRVDHPACERARIDLAVFVVIAALLSLVLWATVWLAIKSL